MTTKRKPVDYDYELIAKYVQKRSPFFSLIQHDMIYCVDDHENGLYVLDQAIPLHKINELGDMRLKQCLFRSMVIQLGYTPKFEDKRMSFLFVYE